MSNWQNGVGFSLKSVGALNLRSSKIILVHPKYEMFFSNSAIRFSFIFASFLVTVTIVERAITIDREKHKLSHEPMYKTDTKIDRERH